MAKNSVRDYSATASLNTDVQSVDIDEGCAPSGINNAIREVMADLKNVSTGAIALESPSADSLTVTGNLTVGTDNLIVNSTGIGIGASPQKGIHLNENDSEAVILIQSSDTGTAGVYMGDQSDSIVGGIIYDNNTDTLQLRSSNNHTAVTIDSSENVMVGTTDSTLWSNTTSTGTGLKLGGDRLEVHADGADCMRLNRTTSDGGIQYFYKNGTAIGSIGVDYDSRLYIGTGDTGLFFNDVSDTVQPISTTAGLRSNAVDLGSSGTTFKDAYLGGGVYLGGTVAANKLDDYEEGTWTPVTSSNSGRVGTWDTTLTGNYTKIGRLVQINLTIAGTGMGFTSTNGYSRYSGLPFAVDKPGSGTFASGSVSSAVAGHAFVASDETVWLYAVQSTNTANGINVVFTYYTT